jgi:peptidoglycan-N-acetylglucosamine deacetylase
MPGLKTPEDVFRTWTEDVAYMLRDFAEGVLVVTFHPQIIVRGHRTLGLERWLDELTGMGVAFERLESEAEQFLEGRVYGEYEPRRGGPR